MPNASADVNASTSPSYALTFVVRPRPTNASTCSPSLADAATRSARSRSSATRDGDVVDHEADTGRGHREPLEVAADRAHVLEHALQRRRDRELAKRRTHGTA